MVHNRYFLKKGHVEYLHTEDNISSGQEKNEITQKLYGTGPSAKFHPHLSPRGDMPSLIEHIPSSHVF